MPEPKSSPDFIAFDYCGWNEQQGRFTRVSDGKTLVCQRWMGQMEWDSAQLEWFKQMAPELVVHKCLEGPYRQTDDIFGSVKGIIDKLERRLGRTPNETKVTQET